MRSIRAQHLALSVSGALACLMVGMLLGMAASGGHVSHVFSMIRPDPTSTTPPSVAKRQDVAATSPASSVAPSTVTVTRTAKPRTVTQTKSTTATVTVTMPASTVTQTVTSTLTQPGSTTPPTTSP